MKSGTLTIFDGIHFDDEHPYTTLQAKRILRLLMDELRLRKDLVALGMNAEGAGRPAITGGAHVWDFLPLLGASEEDGFTSYPHLTVGIHADRVTAMVTLPHGVRREILRHLAGLGADRFAAILADVTGKMSAALARVDGARPTLYVQQRHYRSQRSAPTVDALLDFDLRTVARTEGSGVKRQPQWANAAFEVINSKKSNIQLGVGAQLPMPLGSPPSCGRPARRRPKRHPWKGSSPAPPIAGAGDGLQ